MKLIFDGSIERVSTRRDKTISLLIGSQELSPEMNARLFNLANKHTKILISDTNITEGEASEVEKVVIEKQKGKTPSQRLRGALFGLYEASANKSVNTFEDFYLYEMELIISDIKLKIEQSK